jgi:hypothetical protein
MQLNCHKQQESGEKERAVQCFLSFSLLLMLLTQSLTVLLNSLALQFGFSGCGKVSSAQ